MSIEYTEELLQEKKTIERAGRFHLFHWIVVIFSLTLTFSAWYISKTSIEEKVLLQFDRQATQVVELVSERMRKYEDVLWSGTAAIAATGGDISHKDWVSFANQLHIEEKYPGINGIGVIHYVAPEKMDAYLAEQRKSRASYAVHPAHNKNEFWPITYIEPVAVNAKAVGLDMAHETNRHMAGIKARDTGDAQITGPITLVQDTGKTPGFLFFAPFYKGGIYNSQAERKEHFTGMVYAPFVFKKLLEGTLQKEKRHVGIKIIDDKDVLYDEHTDSNADYDHTPLFKKKYEVNMYGRTWLFDIRTTKAFRENEAGNKQPLIILVGGIIIDTMLLAILILLVSSNRRAINFVKKISEM